MHRLANLRFILAIALLLRVVFLLLAGVNAPLVGDELAYQQIAVNVAAGRGFVQDNNPFFPGQLLYAWQAPLYPLSLAGLYLFFGPHPLVAKVFGILLGVATVYLTFDLARRVFSPSPNFQEESPSFGSKGTPGVAWLAAIVVAVYPGFLTNAHLLLSETLLTFLLVFAFDLVAAAIDADPLFFPNTKMGPGAAAPLADTDLALHPLAEGDPSRLPLAAGVVSFDEGADPSPVSLPKSSRGREGEGNAHDVKAVSVSKSHSKGGRAGVLLLAAAGVMWGAATLTRGITLYFVLPLALWVAVKWVPTTGVAWTGFERRRNRFPFELNLRMGIVFAVAMAAAMAPWLIRNFTVFGEPVLSETKGGVNFWLGNNPYTPSDFIRNVWKTGVREPMLAALPSGEIARDSAGYSLGELFVAREPLTFIARMPVKFADFWGFERNLVDAAEATRNGKPGGWNSLGKIAADFVSDAAYVLVVILAVAGLVFAKEDRWKLLFGSFILYFVFVHMVVFGDGRFHLPLIPFLALYAAWFVVNLFRGLRWRSSRGLTALALALVFAAVWAHEIAAAWMEFRGGL